MTRQEFAEKWGYQSGVGYGSAQFDCKASLLKDLDVLIADEVKNLALPQVSKCESIERRTSLIAFIQEKVKNRDMNLFMNASELVDQMLKRNL
jgi:hypothetical protein